MPAEYSKWGQVLSGQPLTNGHVHHCHLGMLEDNNATDLQSQESTVPLEPGPT